VQLAYLTFDQAETEPLDWVTKDGGLYRTLDVIDIEQEMIQRLWDLYSAAYQGVSDNLLAKGSYHFIKYQRWVLIADPKGDICAFALFKETQYGCKLGLAAADLKSRPAKRALVTFLIKVFQVRGVYAEVSDRIRELVEGRVPEVRPGVAAKVLFPKKIATSQDRRSYQRTLPNIGVVTKMMVGRPINTT